MKKQLSIASVVGAAAAGLVFADTCQFVPALACCGYMAFWGYAQAVVIRKKKPRVGTQGNENEKVIHTEILDFYDNSSVSKKQEEVRKVWTTHGLTLTTLHYTD